MNIRIQSLRLLKVAGVLAFLAFLSGSTLLAEDVCKFSYKGFPENLLGQTIDVGEKMVALSDFIYVGVPTWITPITVATPAIFLLIDNSGSMFQNASAQDRWGNRFNVTSAVLDTIYKKAPRAEVGLGVFNQQLFFDPVDNPRFVKLPAPRDTGGYMPLMKLDSMYKPENKTGYQILKDLLKTDTLIAPPSFKYIGLVYQPKDSVLKIGNTNIDVGFEAAKHALDRSKYQKKFRFVLFFSDGEANYPRNNFKNHIKGVDVPTTFTIFFTRTSQAPQSLIDMTDSIRINKYSETNPKSNLWPFNNTSPDTLKKFIIENVLNTIIQVSKSFPNNIKINNTNPVSPWNQQGFQFADMFGLTGEITPFSYSIEYHVVKDSVTPDGLIIKVEKDTTVKIDYKVRVKNGATLPDTFLVQCWDRKIRFFLQDKEITSANELMKRLQVRFIESKVDVLYGYKDVSLELVTSTDREIMKLEKSGEVHSFEFPLEYLHTGSATKDNGTVEVQASDNIIAIFRNPKLPLDTLRYTLPFNLSTALNIKNVFYYDTEADGYIDSLFLEIDGGLKSEHIKDIMDRVTLPKFRDFAVTNTAIGTGGFTALVQEKRNGEPITSLTADDKVSVAGGVLPSGGFLASGQPPCVDKVAPVIAPANKDHPSAHLIDYLSDSLDDTLDVWFSEPVVKTPDKCKPFLFKNVKRDVIYVATLQYLRHAANRMTFRVDDLKTSSNGQHDYIRHGDSIWINDVTAQVADEVSNAQDEKRNVRRIIAVEQRIAEIVVIPVALNPARISGNFALIEKLPDAVLDSLTAENKEEITITNKKGVLLQVQPRDPIEKLPRFKLEATVSVLDALGNYMIKRKAMGFNSNTGCASYVWNAMNYNGRKAGRGTYLVVFDVTIFQGQNFESKSRPKKPLRLMLGIID
ncbi:MAG: hypothetical protein JW795_04350 [Chitinivibrionales bacterium]|nr:hypothetical protein [Chitinivibrionales bacterium]